MRGEGGAEDLEEEEEGPMFWALASSLPGPRGHKEGVLSYLQPSKRGGGGGGGRRGEGGGGRGGSDLLEICLFLLRVGGGGGVRGCCNECR